MKQNSQWLSQVRTRSKIAAETSSPSGSPACFDDRDLELDPAADDLEVDDGLVGEQLVLDDVPGHLPVHRAELVAGPDPGTLCRRMLGHGHYLRSRHFQRLPLSPVNPARDQPPGGGVRRVERVLLAQPRGFCAGVEMAIKALAWMVRVFEPPVYCYHEIVHNRLVVEEFRRQGVVFVDDVDEVPPFAPLMLSAHGSAPEVEEAAAANGRVVVDACCPLVTKVHHELKVRARKGYTILYVGHAGHEEAIGTMAVAPGAVRLLESERDVDSLELDPVDAGRVARPDDARPRRVGGHRRPGPQALPRAVDAGPLGPLLRHHQPPDRGQGSGGRVVTP